MGTPMPAILPAIAWVCGFSQSWGCLACCFRSCCGSGNWGLMGMGWRRLLLPRVRHRLCKLPISGGCDSSVWLGFEVWDESVLPSLRMQRLSGLDWGGNRMVWEHPKIGRNTLIFWKCRGYVGYSRPAQTVQHKLLMPHPSDCGPEQAT
jgi:hypothetical protein